MGYSKLHYDEYLEHIDYWAGDLGLELPQWADEVSAYGQSVCAIDFYDDLFGEDLEPSRLPEDYQTGEYGAIALEIVESKVKGQKKKQRRGRRYTVTEGNMELYDLIDASENFCMIAPVSYAGRARKNENARYLYALCVEIDNIAGKSGIKELFYTFKRPVLRLPHPTYVVCSGNGLHLYWVFERPIPLFRNVFQQLSEIKNYLTRHLWDKQISTSWQHIQYESLCQAFRCVGSLGKSKKRVAMAFEVGRKLSIEDLNASLPDNLKMNVVYKSNLPLKKAASLYPDWYQRRIVEGAPRGHYTRHEGIYYNWIKKIMDPDSGAQVGQRYRCLENLCSLAVQCQIAPEQVEKDCRMVAEYMEQLTVEEKNHFTEYDVLCALKTYHTAGEGAYRRRIDYISKRTGIELKPNLRRGRKQSTHLKIARNTLAVMNEDRGEALQGRPNKREIVLAWRRSNPDGRKIDCERETGLSRPTICKWWDSQSDDPDFLYRDDSGAEYFVELMVDKRRKKV